MALRASVTTFFAAFAATLAGLAVPGLAVPAEGRAACAKPLYLTFDTGSQSQAEWIRDLLRRHAVKATFFLANEKTVRGDHALDPQWTGYWQSLVADGHAFGSHTFDHVYYRGKGKGDRVRMRPQFGPQAGQWLEWDGAQFCAELDRVRDRFRQLTGATLDPYWRAPGGKTSEALNAMAKRCGYIHVGWSEAGFLGDELSSEQFPNAHLLERALKNIRSGDILMAHLGIWSRKQAFAPMLDPLITGLKQQGYCFETLHDHPVLGLRRAGSARSESVPRRP